MSKTQAAATAPEPTFADLEDAKRAYEVAHTTAQSLLDRSRNATARRQRAERAIARGDLTAEEATGAAHELLAARQQEAQVQAELAWFTDNSLPLKDAYEQLRTALYTQARGGYLVRWKAALVKVEAAAFNLAEAFQEADQVRREAHDLCERHFESGFGFVRPLAGVFERLIGTGFRGVRTPFETWRRECQEKGWLQAKPEEAKARAEAEERLAKATTEHQRKEREETERLERERQKLLATRER